MNINNTYPTSDSLAQKTLDDATLPHINASFEKSAKSHVARQIIPASQANRSSLESASISDTKSRKPRMIAGQYAALVCFFD